MTESLVFDCPLLLGADRVPIPAAPSLGPIGGLLRDRALPIREPDARAAVYTNHSARARKGSCPLTLILTCPPTPFRLTARLRPRKHGTWRGKTETSDVIDSTSPCAFQHFRRVVLEQRTGEILQQ